MTLGFTLVLLPPPPPPLPPEQIARKPEAKRSRGNGASWGSPPPACGSFVCVALFCIRENPPC
eukprot:1538543-Pyramimonas_sp.AAC.1